MNGGDLECCCEKRRRGNRWKERSEEESTCGRSMGGMPRGANASCNWFTIGMSSLSGIFGG
jgi:hypothetical protein